ncbi:hypothetical protein JNO54_06350 [Janibacter sp. YIM B02568]|uniref:hypothetical protein n=1 Tax=Janibacter endophyticus TaxID=2806261 RepID=UPI001951763D|nr:hypothetical protein [Janibacter endophyticus]MBM6545759.1 hypothetical protein [Janibacter endophyticus]
MGTLVTGRQGKIRGRTMAGVAALTAAGFLDDQSVDGVNPYIRLAVQAVAGAVFGPSLAVAPISSLGTAGTVNVVNFMDGIDGITGGIAAVWGVSTLCAGRRERDAVLQTFGSVTAGAGLGFLPWNLSRDRFFLGDVGSYLFGSLMAASISHVATRPQLALRVAAPLLPYMVDATQALVRRAMSGDSLTEAHRGHAYQRLVDEHGLTHSSVALAHSVTAAVIAISVANLPGRISVGVAAATSAAYVTAPLWFDAEAFRPIERGGTP